MKSLLLAAALTGVSFASSAFAFTPTAVTSPAPRPVLDSVVKPTGLPLTFAGGVINIEFTLDSSGAPREIQIHAVRDAALRRQLLKAFSQWRFEAGATDATNAQKRFILPLQITPEV